MVLNTSYTSFKLDCHLLPKKSNSEEDNCHNELNVYNFDTKFCTDFANYS